MVNLENFKAVAERVKEIHGVFDAATFKIPPLEKVIAKQNNASEGVFNG